MTSGNDSQIDVFTVFILDIQFLCVTLCLQQYDLNDSRIYQMFVSNSMTWPVATAQRLHLHLFGAAGGVEYRALLPMLSTQGENGQVLGSAEKHSFNCLQGFMV